MNEHDEILTPEQLAERWKVSTATLKNWRTKGTGVRWFKLSEGIARYRLSDVIAYENSQADKKAKELESR